jgi:hypothetical protein
MIKGLKKNVLIFPGGTEIGLEIRNSLKDIKEINLYSAGSDVSNHASYVFKNHSIVPDINIKGWIGALNKILNKYAIDYIFPAHDDIIVALASNSDRIDAKIISSPLSTCLLTRSKTETYNKFKDLIPTPKTFNKIKEIDSFPVFVKPDKGQGSQNSFKINDSELLKALLKSNHEYIILEYLNGKEYTVDCFTDRNKGLLFCGGRERIRTKSGISMDSKPVDPKINKIFRYYANIISQELEIHGAWFFQLKLDSSGIFTLLEIAPRISGTMATHRVLGINFPLLSIYEKEGLNIDLMINNYHLQIDRALVNRYKHDIKYKTVYVDLDDTLILNDRINTELIKFLYQSLNKDCKLILITKSVNITENYLKKWRLANLFDEIIFLNNEDSKADHVDPENSIFIDDSFSERKSVFDKHKIPTFDCSMLELLIDSKV